MDKQNQGILDLLQSLPLSSFMATRSLISNKEAQTLYNMWQTGDKDEYGKTIVDSEVDPMQIASLTSKGYVKNTPSRFSNSPIRLLEFTNKGKDVIKQIILHEETSAFEKKSGTIDYEAICRKTAKKIPSSKVASQQLSQKHSWLQRLI